ncbi:SRPBCC family protein [Amaricoccus solimangrovi]|uniref:SRPBCC family protein n=1 Tax=Amaricoccus solimangrovi TaxID=2589815 RepID=A0A501WI96_9RHOB|nr:SRPBCC family protein [Amaricoccus solimangrovi]TPE48512.1 SRPBCC family protein [Amaricoccus solimangrovi]
MKFVSVAIAALAVALAPVAASAHGPVRQKVEETIDIAAPPETVWARVGNFDDMSWLPGVVSTEATNGNEIDSERTLTLNDASGPKIVEVLDKYDATKRSYKYRIESVDVKVLPVTNYSSTIEVDDGPDGGSTVHWKGAFYRGFPNNDPPAELNDEAAIAAVTKLYQSGLAALKSEIEKTN